MKKIINSMRIAVVGIIVALYTNNVYAVSDHRHIYNNSNQPWTVWANSDHGNVYFEVPGCQSQKNGPCTIPPHTSVTTKWTHGDWNSEANGNLRLKDYTGLEVGLNYDNGGAGACPWFRVQGDEKGVGFNFPANADISINKNCASWSLCPPGKGFYDYTPSIEYKANIHLSFSGTKAVKQKIFYQLVNRKNGVVIIPRTQLTSNESNISFSLERFFLSKAGQREHSSEQDLDFIVGGITTNIGDDVAYKFIIQALDVAQIQFGHCSSSLGPRTIIIYDCHHNVNLRGSKFSVKNIGQLTDAVNNAGPYGFTGNIGATCEDEPHNYPAPCHDKTPVKSIIKDVYIKLNYNAPIVDASRLPSGIASFKVNEDKKI